jgi:SAM-dependent methyltransferase
MMKNNNKWGLINWFGACTGALVSLFLRTRLSRGAFLSATRTALFANRGLHDTTTPVLSSEFDLGLESVIDRARNLGDIVGRSAIMRNDWIARVARELPSGARVLDAGAGECQYKHLFSHTRYYAQDFAAYTGSAEGMQKETWSYGHLDYVCDITAIPVPDCSFDAVICTEVLEHLPDPIGALRELVRVLIPGGSLILSAPLGAGLHQQPHHYFGGFTPWFYRHYFEEMGVVVEEITPLGGLLQHVAQEMHRVGVYLQQNVDSTSTYLPVSKLLAEEFPRILESLDDKFFVEDFTVGYVVKGVKA